MTLWNLDLGLLWLTLWLVCLLVDGEDLHRLAGALLPQRVALQILNTKIAFSDILQVKIVKRYSIPY